MSFVREHIVKRFTRSRGWRKVRRHHLEEEPICAVCGRKKGREVHHIQDFSTHPENELALWNLITLCRPHHLLVGHLMNFKSINPTVEEDARDWQGKILARRK